MVPYIALCLIFRKKFSDDGLAKTRRIKQLYFVSSLIEDAQIRKSVDDVNAKTGKLRTVNTVLYTLCFEFGKLLCALSFVCKKGAQKSGFLPEPIFWLDYNTITLIIWYGKGFM